MVAYINSVLKALVAGIGGGIASLVSATVDGSTISTNEWLVAAGAFVALFGATYIVPNTAAK
jgi:hypothetical protein